MAGCSLWMQIYSNSAQLAVGSKLFVNQNKEIWLGTMETCKLAWSYICMKTYNVDESSLKKNGESIFLHFVSQRVSPSYLKTKSTERYFLFCTE